MSRTSATACSAAPGAACPAWISRPSGRRRLCRQCLRPAPTWVDRRPLQSPPTQAGHQRHKTVRAEPAQPTDRGPERLRGVWADCSPQPRSRPGSSPAPRSDLPRPTHQQTARPWPSEHLPASSQTPASHSRRLQLPPRPRPSPRRQSPQARPPPNTPLLRAPPLPRKAQLPANPLAAARKAPPQKGPHPEGPPKALNRRLELRSNCRRSSTCG